MTVRFINGGRSALIQYSQRTIFVEQAKVILKRFANYWARVLVGHGSNGEFIRIVLGALSLGERILAGLKSLVADLQFGLHLQIGSLFNLTVVSRGD